MIMLSMMGTAGKISDPHGVSLFAIVDDDAEKEAEVDE